MTFGNRLKKARIAKKLSQEQLGKGLGVLGVDVTKQTVYGWEKDHHHPTTRQLALICAKLGESADWLLLGKAPNNDMRNLTGWEGQIVLMFRGMSEEDQEQLLQQANKGFSKSNPARSVANPFGKPVHIETEDYSGPDRRAARQQLES